MTSRYGWPLTEAGPDPSLDLASGVGQRVSTFAFSLVDGVSGEYLGRITPVGAPSLSHSASSTIPRTLSLDLGPADSAVFDPIRHRILPSMLIGDVTWPLGRYMAADVDTEVWTGGDRMALSMVDEMMIVDQDTEDTITAGISDEEYEEGEPTDRVIRRVLEDVPVQAVIEPSVGRTAGSWSSGTSRAQILSDLATDGGYLSPWMDHRGRLRMRIAPDLRDVVPDIDWDQGTPVVIGSTRRGNDLIEAPNRYIVVGNAGTDAPPVVGRWDVPASAPNSIASRGYVIPYSVERQVTTSAAAASIARGLWLLGDVYERVELSTAPDPRHDGHTIIRWDDETWLETGWSMTLSAGQPMTDTLRRLYA